MSSSARSGSRPTRPPGAALPRPSSNAPTNELEAAGLDPDDRLLQLVQAVAEEEFAAGGGATTHTEPR